MTATSAGSSSCLAAKGLDISLAALKRQDPYINNIVDVASQVALYTYNNRSNEWEKTEVEGTLFIYTRLASPRHGFTIKNRLSMENLTEPITKDLDFQLQDPFLLYRNARLVIHGIWFYDKEDCQRIAQRMKILTQQEQVLAQSQGGWLSPGGAVVSVVASGGDGVGNDSKTVDILQMLSKARTEYDKEKSTSEPKEIGGSSVLCGNPNLIKPIPVKLSTQDSEGAEPQSLSLATLFGSQNHPHRSPKSDPSVSGKVARPPVARTLTYDDAVNSGRSVAANGESAPIPGISDGAIRAIIGENHVKAVAGLLPNPTTAHQQQHQHQPNQPQHCPAIAKLMQGQRGVAGLGGVLQTVSESPENRLCDNGVPLEHHQHHHHHHLYHQQQQLHHHHHHQQQPDPIQRLFQTQPTCCPHPPLPMQQKPHPSSQPVLADAVSCSHVQAQQSQQLPSQVTSDQLIRPSQGLSSQMPGVVSPHELLQKLQLVQQEQNQASSHNAARLCPSLAPRFLGPTQNQGAALGVVPATAPPTAGQKAALQLQVISPQRIPATVAPTLLLSPSMFSQTKSSTLLPVVAQESCPSLSTLPRPVLQEEIRVLSRSQLQATLLHLIQTDGSFLDSIYEAYISRFTHNASSKY